MKINTVRLIGRGAVGVTMASTLANALGPEKAAFIMDEKRKEKYEANPLMVNDKPAEFVYLTPKENEQKADLILFFTKYGGLKDAMESAAPFVKEDTILMSGINGIVSEDDLKERFPENTVIRTIAQKMDSRYKDNEVTFSQKGELVFGMEDESQKEAVQAVKDLFNATGLPYVLSENIVQDQWNKLMLNCGLNQVSAAFDAPYGRIVNEPKLMQTFMDAMEEVRAVALARGIQISDAMVSDWVESLKTYDPESMPSMRQDVLAGRPTEEALFSATVVPMAKELGIQTPVLEMLMARINEIDEANKAKIQDR